MEGAAKASNACKLAGQSGLVNEYGDVLPAPPPPTLKISEVVKEQTFEHHVAARLRTSPPPIAPALAPDAGEHRKAHTSFSA
jgi:hypothetical protein